MGDSSSAGRYCVFYTIKRQQYIKILCPKDPEFFSPLALNCQKGQHLPALHVYKNQSPSVMVAISGRPVLKPLFSDMHAFRYRPKGVFRKGVGNSKNASEIRQKCIRNA